MTTMTTNGHATGSVKSASGSRRRARARSVGGAVLATGALYLAGRAAGVAFTLTDPGSTQHLTLALYQIAMFTAVFALLGWAALALLERYTRRAKVIWASLAGSVLLLSFVPIAIEGASPATKAMLVTIHCTVAASLALMLRRTADRK